METDGIWETWWWRCQCSGACSSHPADSSPWPPGHSVRSLIHYWCRKPWWKWQSMPYLTTLAKRSSSFLKAEFRPINSPPWPYWVFEKGLNILADCSTWLQISNQSSSLAVLSSREKVIFGCSSSAFLTSGMPITPLRATLFFFTKAVTSSRELEGRGWNQLQNGKEKSQPARSSIHFRKVDLLKVNLQIENLRSEHSQNDMKDIP